jgi:zinc D-Ala-D-Ala carboxypeptidase
MRLSPNFELAEFVTSREASARGIDNTPPPAFIPHLQQVANALERVRSVVLGGRPITITSGFRCPRLNTAVGGSPQSAHMTGFAADFICPSFGTPVEICHAIVRHGIPFDQLIYEYDWVHFGLALTFRNQILTYAGGGKYVAGIVEKA